MSVLRGTPESLPRAVRGGGIRRFGARSSPALVALLTACTFDVPAVGVLSPPSQIQVDAGMAADALPVDLGFADSGPNDLGFADSGPNPDASGDVGVHPDAAPADADPIDMGFDAGFVDTGAPDTGAPDTGVGPACPLALPPSDPAVVGQLALPHAIDRPLLIADLDQDLEDEIVAASASDDVFSVIDFPSCGSAVITTKRNVPIGLDGLVRGGQRLLIAAGNGQVTRWRYDALPVPAISAVGLPLTLTEASYLGGHPSGSHTIVTGRNAMGAAAFLTIDVPGGSESTTSLQSRLTAQPAYLTTRAGDPPMFVAVDEFSALVLEIQGTPTFLEDEANVAPSTPPVVVQPGHLSTDHGVVLYGATLGNGGQLRTSRVDTSDLNFRFRWGTDLTAQMASEPIVTSRDKRGPDDHIIAYYTTSDGMVTGCKLGVQGGTAATCDDYDGVDEFSIGGGETSARVTPLATYVDDDQHVDLILTAAQAGTLYFRATDLDDESAPSVALGSPVVATGALSTSFYIRRGQEGTLFAVPHPAGQISFVAWPADNSWGPQSRNWRQYRRDSTRSASF